jgi:hypothetical protein
VPVADDYECVFDGLVADLGEDPQPVAGALAVARVAGPALMALAPKGTGWKRWTMRWKIALQAFETTFPGRLRIDSNQPETTGR